MDSNRCKEYKKSAQILGYISLPLLSTQFVENCPISIATETRVCTTLTKLHLSKLSGQKNAMPIFEANAIIFW